MFLFWTKLAAKQQYFWYPQSQREYLFLTFSTGEPTAKQLSKASSELTTNLEIRQQLDRESNALY